MRTACFTHEFVAAAALDKAVSDTSVPFAKLAFATQRAAACCAEESAARSALEVRVYASAVVAQQTIALAALPRAVFAHVVLSNCCTTRGDSNPLLAAAVAISGCEPVDHALFMVEREW